MKLLSEPVFGITDAATAESALAEDSVLRESELVSAVTEPISDEVIKGLQTFL